MTSTAPRKMSKAKKDVVPKAVPIQRSDLSTFDDSYSFLKEKFQAEMARLDEEMNRFSVNLMTLYGQHSSTAESAASNESQPPWDALANSPLIHGEGSDKILKLQFDFSTFEPSDIKVELLGDTLVVFAHHEQKTDTSTVVREFKREFVLPRGIDPNTVISTLSRDGVLSVQAPLPPLVAPQKGAKESKVLSKNPQDSAAKAPKPGKTSTDSHKDVPALEDKVPAAVTGAVPPSPLSTVSPASPQTLTTNPASPLASVKPSKITRPGAK